MVDANIYYGEYLKAEDVKKDIRVKVKAVTVESVDGEIKIVVEFDEIRKKLVLNKTNKDTLKKNIGTSETDEWIGKYCVIGVDMVEFRGEKVPALRIRDTVIRQKEILLPGAG